MHPAVRSSSGNNPAFAQAGWPPVVVAGAYHTGILLMRNLIKRGLKVWAFDANPLQPGFSSVYGKTLLCPNPDTDPAGWFAFMTDLAARIAESGSKPVLIPAADQFVTAIAEHFVALAGHYIFSDSIALQSVLATKESQYDLARKYGMPIPRTEDIESPEQLDSFAASARFPCLIKPLHCREWEQIPPTHPFWNTKLAFASSAEELRAHYQAVAPYTPHIVVQEVIEGPDTTKLVSLSCYGRSGERIAHCIVRQLRTFPIGYGSASVVEPVEDAETSELSDRFFRNIGYTGICELEMKRDTRDGKVKLIEANPRYSVTADAAPYAGVDIGWLHYLDLIGIRVQPVTQKPNNFRHICLQRDFGTIRSYRKAGLLTWRGLLRSYRPPVHFFDFDVQDWRVSFATLIQLFKIVFAPAFRRIIPKRSRWLPRAARN